MKFWLFPLALLYAVPFYLTMSSWQMFAWFGVGLAVGILLLMADELLFYRYYAAQTPEALQLITRSPLFLAVYPIVALFAITSSGNLFGIGMVLGMGLTLVFEAIIIMNQPEAVKQRFAQHLAVKISDQDVVNLVVVGGLVFVALSLVAFLQ